MKDIIDALKKYNLRSNHYEIKGNVVFITSKDGKYVVKKSFTPKSSPTKIAASATGKFIGVFLTYTLSFCNLNIPFL